MLFVHKYTIDLSRWMVMYGSMVALEAVTQAKILVAFYIQPPPTLESSSIQFINTKRLIFSSVFTEIHISLFICNHWAHLHLMLPIMMNSFLDFSHWSCRSQLNERHWCPSFFVKKYECSLFPRLSVSHREPFYRLSELAIHSSASLCVLTMTNTALLMEPPG